MSIPQVLLPFPSLVPNQLELEQEDPKAPEAVHQEAPEAEVQPEVQAEAVLQAHPVRDSDKNRCYGIAVFFTHA